MHGVCGEYGPLFGLDLCGEFQEGEEVGGPLVVSPYISLGRNTFSESSFVKLVLNLLLGSIRWVMHVMRTRPILFQYFLCVEC